MLNKLIANAMSAILVLSATTALAKTTEPEMGPGPGMEKCYGIAKAGMNDCGTINHTCSGESKVDRDKTSWLAVPNGLCKRIAGGSLTPGDKP